MINHESINTCHDYKKIARWINDQVVRTDKLKHFNRHLGKLIQSLNDSETKEHCCFYEKLTMSRIFENINKLANETARPNKELGKDLDQILKMIKNLLSKDMKTCCEQLYEALIKLELNFQKQLNDLKKSTEQNNENRNQQRDKLKKEQTELEKQIKDLSSHLVNMEKQVKDNESTATNCCNKSEDKIKQLNDTIQAERKAIEDEANNLKNQINHLTENQSEQNNSINNATQTVNSRTESIESALKKCELSETASDQLKNSSVLEKRIQELEDITKILSDRISNNGSITPVCQKIEEDMLQFRNLTAKLQKVQKKGNEYLQNKVQKLENQMEISKGCCDKIQKLEDNAIKIRNDITTMNTSYNEHIKGLESRLEELKNRLDEALMKVSKENDSKNGNDRNELSQSIKDLQQQLNDAKNELKQISHHKNETEAQIELFIENCNKKFSELNNSIIAEVKANNELIEEFEIRLDKIDERLKHQNHSMLDLVKRINHLETHLEILNKNIARVQELQNRKDDLQKLIKDELNKIANLQAQVSACVVKCKKMNQVDDLIDRIEDLEKIAKNCPHTTQKPKIVLEKSTTTTAKPATPATTTRKRNRRPSGVIGGAHDAAEKWGDDWLKKTRRTKVEFNQYGN
ncbi:uncharacterized protein Dwil_GK27389 [Drosophila willistoni]|uniref:Uncharacterized protein n=2 Tax=Drosophila willistoni TaxID=7260 RepID=A0A0Q9X0N1_DROWI|nr:uncharacterized protein Dwil_GK27389 [Drosophila willistoni]